jgi:tRNA/tmRNA/rRNA uracil-C5-methylase (TrmA/RlmC/RlmD family)
VHRMEERLGPAGLAGIVSMEIAENMPGSERACHLEVQSGIDVNALAALSMEQGLTGLSASRLLRPGVERLSGATTVTDLIHVSDDTPPHAIRLRRDVRSFFQGNRFLLEQLTRHVLALVPEGPVADLYAGVGLFGLSRAALGCDQITLVEGDPVSGADLEGNAEAFADRVRVRRSSVEEWLGLTHAVRPTTILVDPPRTGMSRDAVVGILRIKPERVVYVSCDVATLARDLRVFIDAGYSLDHLTGFDLFPNTAHVESVAVLQRS